MTIIEVEEPNPTPVLMSSELACFAGEVPDVVNQSLHQQVVLVRLSRLCAPPLVYYRICRDFYLYLVVFLQLLCVLGASVLATMDTQRRRDTRCSEVLT